MATEEEILRAIYGASTNWWFSLYHAALLVTMGIPVGSRVAIIAQEDIPAGAFTGLTNVRRAKGVYLVDAYLVAEE